MPTVPGLVLSDITADVRSDYSSEAIKDVGYLKVKLLDISTETLYRQAVFIWGGLFYLTSETGPYAFSFALLHFGRTSDIECFKYRIKIGNPEENVALTRQCHSYCKLTLGICSLESVAQFNIVH
jgi:hypothetical protein